MLSVKQDISCSWADVVASFHQNEHLFKGDVNLGPGTVERVGLRDTPSIVRILQKLLLVTYREHPLQGVGPGHTSTSSSWPRAYTRPNTQQQ